MVRIVGTREVHWREAPPTWSWESEGSGVMKDEGMVSDLVRCSLTSSGIIGENFLANWGLKKVLNKIIPLIVSDVY